VPSRRKVPAVLTITRIFPEDATVTRFEEKAPRCP